MLIVWGKKIRRKGKGVIAEICPICRDTTCCELTLISTVDHLYYIPIPGSMEPKHFETRCGACGLTLPRDASVTKVYTPIQGPAPSVHELAEATNPGVFEHVDQLLEVQREIADRSLSSQRRLDLILQSLSAMTYMTQLKAKSSSDESLQAVAVVLLIPGIAATPILFFNGQNLYGAIAGAVTLLWLAFVMRLIVRGPRRTIARTTLPTLRIALEPLRVTAAEAVEVAAILKKQKDPIAAWIKARDIEAASAPKV